MQIPQTLRPGPRPPPLRNAPPANVPRALHSMGSSGDGSTALEIHWVEFACMYCEGAATADIDGEYMLVESIMSDTARAIIDRMILRML